LVGGGGLSGFVYPRCSFAPRVPQPPAPERRSTSACGRCSKRRPPSRWANMRGAWVTQQEAGVRDRRAVVIPPFDTTPLRPSSPASPTGRRGTRGRSCWRAATASGSQRRGRARPWRTSCPPALTSGTTDAPASPVMPLPPKDPKVRLPPPSLSRALWSPIQSPPQLSREDHAECLCPARWPPPPPPPQGLRRDGGRRC